MDAALLHARAAKAGLSQQEIADLINKYGAEVLGLVTGLLEGGFQKGWILDTLGKLAPIVISLVNDILNPPAGGTKAMAAGTIIQLIQWIMQEAPVLMQYLPQLVQLIPVLQQYMPQIQAILQAIGPIIQFISQLLSQQHPTPGPGPTPVVPPVPQVPTT